MKKIVLSIILLIITLSLGLIIALVKNHNKVQDDSILTLKGHKNRVWSVDYSYDGKFIASGSWDKTIKIWNAKTGDCIQTLKGHEGYVYGVAFSPDGKTLVSGGDDCTVKLWDVEKGYCIRDFIGHDGSVYGVAFSPDGRFVVSGGTDGTVKIWEIGGKCIHTLGDNNLYYNTTIKHSVYSVAFSPDGRFIAAGYSSSESLGFSVKLWNVENGECVYTIMGSIMTPKSNVYAIRYSPDGRYIATASHQSLILLDSVSGEFRRSFWEHNKKVTSVAFSPNGRYFATGSVDRTLKIWDISCFQSVLTLTGHKSDVWGIAFSPDGLHVASGSNDDTIKIWAPFLK